MRNRLSSFWLLFIFLPATSYALNIPKGQIILTVSGAIEITNAPNAAVFDLDMLQALPQKTITTGTPWVKGVHTYRGFSAVDLLEQVGNKGALLQVIALNEYMTEIPLVDFAEHGAIFATHQDGHRISVRNLGPIKVVYPFDTNPVLKTEVFFSRSIWQINKIKSVIITE